MRIEFLIPWGLNASESERYCAELRANYNVRLGGTDMSVLQATDDHRIYRMRFGDRYYKGSKSFMLSGLSSQSMLIPYVVLDTSLE